MNSKRPYNKKTPVVAKYPKRMPTVDVEPETEEGVKLLAELSKRSVADYRRTLYKDAIKNKRVL